MAHIDNYSLHFTHFDSLMHHDVIRISIEPSFFFLWVKLGWVVIRYGGTLTGFLPLCASGDQQATSPAAADNTSLHVVWGAGRQSDKLLQGFICHPEHFAEEQGSRAARAGNVYNSITALSQLLQLLESVTIYVVCDLYFRSLRCWKCFMCVCRASQKSRWALQ